MTFQEFKLWLEGFREAVDGSPTEEQWNKILEKLEEIEADKEMVPVPQEPQMPAPKDPPIHPWLDKPCMLDPSYPTWIGIKNQVLSEELLK